MPNISDEIEREIIAQEQQKKDLEKLQKKFAERRAAEHAKNVTKCRKHADEAAEIATNFVRDRFIKDLANEKLAKRSIESFSGMYRAPEVSLGLNYRAAAGEDYYEKAIVDILNRSFIRNNDIYRYTLLKINGQKILAIRHKDNPPIVSRAPVSPNPQLSRNPTQLGNPIVQYPSSFVGNVRAATLRPATLQSSHGTIPTLDSIPASHLTASQNDDRPRFF